MGSTAKTTVTARHHSKSTGVIIGGVLAAVTAAVLIAVAVALSTGGNSNSPFPDDATIREFQGVEVVPEGATLPLLAAGTPDPAVGKEAPGLVGANFDGTPVTVTPGDGTPYMLVFLAHWCPHCNAELPRIVEWYESGRIPEGLEVVGIATGTDAKLQNYPPSEWMMADNNWPFAAMADSPQGVARTTYGLDGYPFIVLIDDNGKVALRTSGEKGVDVIDQMVDDALGFTPADDSGTPASTPGT
jgi:thiol-disulfide isomerase/thioredoxin